jgi:hypothetical protein
VVPGLLCVGEKAGHLIFRDERGRQEGSGAWLTISRYPGEFYRFMIVSSPHPITYVPVQKFQVKKSKTPKLQWNFGVFITKRLTDG